MDIYGYLWMVYGYQWIVYGYLWMVYGYQWIVYGYQWMVYGYESKPWHPSISWYPKIAGQWMYIPPNLRIVGFDASPYLWISMDINGWYMDIYGYQWMVYVHSPNGYTKAIQYPQFPSGP